MAVISIPHHEPCIVGGPAFRAVLDRLVDALPEGEDRDAVVQARALKGLMFELMPEEQAARIATVLIRVAGDLRNQVISMPEPAVWHIEMADWLSTMEMLLHDLVE